jgi:hypothetical protein
MCEDKAHGWDTDNKVVGPFMKGGQEGHHWRTTCQQGPKEGRR